MNIKQAKEHLKLTVQAYLAKDTYGNPEIPIVAQRPILLMGPPGIGKPPSPTRQPRSAVSPLWPTP